MERPQALPNLWFILQLIGWILALEGVVDYFCYTQYSAFFRQILVPILGHDPARPRPPDNWEEWYNS